MGRRGVRSGEGDDRGRGGGDHRGMTTPVGEGGGGDSRRGRDYKGWGGADAVGEWDRGDHRRGRVDMAGERGWGDHCRGAGWGHERVKAVETGELGGLATTRRSEVGSIVVRPDPAVADHPSGGFGRWVPKQGRLGCPWWLDMAAAAAFVCFF